MAIAFSYLISRRIKRLQCELKTGRGRAPSAGDVKLVSAAASRALRLFFLCLNRSGEFGFAIAASAVICRSNHRESAKFLRRIKATQRLQSCNCLWRRGVAANAGREPDFPFFEIPNWAVRLVVLLLIIGFPVALIIAWAFELTPEGIKRTEETAPNESNHARART